jgi:F-type H+-transporting ATPase subunit b
MNIRHLCLPASLSAALLFSAPALRADEHAAAVQEAQAPHSSSEAQEAPGPHGTEVHGQEARGHEGAHHPEIKLFGKSLGTLAQFGVSLFNFAIFAAILFFFGKAMLTGVFKARAKELEDKLGRAEREKAEAEAQIQELEGRMAGLQQELEGILAKAQADADAEKARILESARTEAGQILGQAQAEIDFQKRQAETELRALVAELAVEGAAKRLEGRLQGDTAARVLNAAIESVGGAK